MTSRLTTLLAAFFVSANLSAAELTVHAAASLADAMKEIGAAYEKETGDKVQFNFGASNMLARQIIEGAPGDLFLSADEARMDLLAEKGLILPDTRRSLLSNTLVIIVPSDAATNPKSAADLTKPEYKKLALAEPETVPAGIYAREYLQRAGLWEQLQTKVVPTENVRGALAAVESGNVEAGLVYRTDALLSKKVKIALEIPTGEGPKISYPVAVLKSSPNAERARKFAAYLASPAAREIFQRLGFVLTE